MQEMKKVGLLKSIFMLGFLVILVVFPIQSVGSELNDVNWKTAIYLWKKYSAYPTRKNAEEFYDYIRKVPLIGKKDLNWFLNSYRFSYEVLAGNKPIVLSALRMSAIAEENQAHQILRHVGKLCRIDARLFLEVLAEGYNFLGDRIRDIITFLPEEHEYLFNKALLSEDFSELLSYFSCYELRKRYEALSFMGERMSLRIKKIRDICLEELRKKSDQIKCHQCAKYDDDEIVRKLTSLWNLPIEDKWLIFDTPLEKDRRLYELIHNNYYEHIIYPIFEYEIFAGNERALDAVITELKVSIISARENTIWELCRIRPELFLCFLYKQDMNTSNKPGRIDFLASYTFLSMDSMEKIIELNHRIDRLSRVKGGQYKYIKIKYIEIMKKLIFREKQKLSSQSQAKRRGV